MTYPSEKEQEQLNTLVNSLPGSIWTFKNKLMKNYMYVRCQSGFVRIDEWRFFDQQSKPAFTFVDQFISKKIVTHDLTSPGHTFF